MVAAQIHRVRRQILLAHLGQHKQVIFFGAGEAVHEQDHPAWILRDGPEQGQSCAVGSVHVAGGEPVEEVEHASRLSLPVCPRAAEHRPDPTMAEDRPGAARGQQRSQ